MFQKLFSRGTESNDGSYTQNNYQLMEAFFVSKRGTGKCLYKGSGQQWQPVLDPICQPPLTACYRGLPVIAGTCTYLTGSSSFSLLPLRSLLSYEKIMWFCAIYLKNKEVCSLNFNDPSEYFNGSVRFSPLNLNKDCLKKHSRYQNLIW